MSQSLYEVLALGARYLFAGLMLLIVLRAWRITLIDSRRAATLRRMSPQTGLSGELMVMAGDGQARRGMKYPVIREGMIGSSRRADIRIRHASVRRRHAYFQLSDNRMHIRTHAGAPMLDGEGRPARSLALADGDALTLGRVSLMLILSGTAAPAVPRRDARDADSEEAPPDPDDLFREQPVLRRVQAPPREKRLGKPIDVDEYFDVDDGEDW
ncbi:MAG: FHA domain-containing protein [Clostridia bacterium]|nr:FHA domain-containing protein [Clostridia bacterium]